MDFPSRNRTSFPLAVLATIRNEWIQWCNYSMLGGKGCRTHMDKHVSQNVSKYRHVSGVAVSHIHQFSLLNHPRLFGCCILIILIHAQDGASPACVLHMPLQFSFYFFGIFHVSLDLRKVASNNPIKHGLRQPVLLNHNRQPSNQYIKCFQNLAALLQRYCSQGTR